jgi:hypothetical protein
MRRPTSAAMRGLRCRPTRPLGWPTPTAPSPASAPPTECLRPHVRGPADPRYGTSNAACQASRCMDCCCLERSSGLKGVPLLGVAPPPPPPPPPTPSGGHAKKGVGAWYFSSQAAALRDVNVAWVYDWQTSASAQVWHPCCLTAQFHCRPLSEGIVAVPQGMLCRAGADDTIWSGLCSSD